MPPVWWLDQRLRKGRRRPLNAVAFHPTEQPDSPPTLSVGMSACQQALGATVRSSRTIALTIVVTFTVILALSVVQTSRAAKPTLTALIAETQQGLWKCQDQRSVGRTRSSVTPWALPKSQRYRQWVLKKWTKRQAQCLVALRAHDGMVRLLNKGLSGSPMAGTGADLEAAGRRHGIHPAFIAAIAGTESSFGAAACSSNRFNAFGLSSCGSGWRVPNFQSWAEVYDFMGAFLSGRWPSASSTFDYHGYAACSECWGRKNAYWMSARFGLGNSVRY